MNEFKAISIKKSDLQKILDAFDSGEYVHFAVELDSIEGDQILWVDNGKFGEDRAYIRINRQHKDKENK
jgi:hypothetical protein